jgi:hypothetical protein
MYSYWLPLLDGFAQHDESTIVAGVADGTTQHCDNNQIANEGDKLLICFPYSISLDQCSYVHNHLG